MFDDKDLANRATVSQMVDAYEKSGEMILEAYRQLWEAQKTLEAAFGSHYSDFSALPDRHQFYASNPEALTASVRERIRQNAWKSIIHRLGIKKVMSIKAAEELDRKLEEAKALPEIEMATVFATLQMLVQNADEYQKKAVMEVYDILRPARSAREHHLKTNLKNARFALGKKVILSWYVEGSYSRVTPFRVNYHRENELRAVDRVFHLLDGAGIPEGYKSELIDAINTSPDGRGDTAYFHFEAYLNRNLHLTFRRLDLVQKLNQLAGAGPELRD